MPFAVLVLSACLLMPRIAPRPARRAARAIRALIGLGLLIGLAALTRNEAIWLAHVGVVAWRAGDRDRRARRSG